MKRLNVLATADEIQQMKDAANAPLIAINCGMPESPQQVAHRLTLAHGLPEIPGYYGCDLRTGEFISL